MIGVAALRGPEIGHPIVWPRSRSSNLDRSTASILTSRPVDPDAGVENAWTAPTQRRGAEWAFPTPAWTGYARPQAPQAQRQQRHSKRK